MSNPPAAWVAELNSGPCAAQCRSDPQMPQASTSTSTSPGPGTGSGTSATCSWESCIKTARITHHPR